MAQRPVFVSLISGSLLYEEVFLDFKWNPGFAPVQKKKNITALHQAGHRAGLESILEISTKSDEPLGQKLSAFNLKYELADGTSIPLECAYQGSKVFENGGPFTDLFFVHPKEARRDSRLQNSGRLTHFNIESTIFPLSPKSAFYDWIYIRCIYKHHEWLEVLFRYDGFTDIEFNPGKSFNCQARSCAVFCSLVSRNKLAYAMESPSNFVSCLTGQLKTHIDPGQQLLF